jgi:hypothetical protein
MGDTPPRRTRRSSAEPGSSLPLIPILLGVVVLGLVIGAGLSVLGNRSASNGIAAIAWPTPAATAELLTPLPARTAHPRATPTEPPPATATPAATRKPAPTATPAAKAPSAATAAPPTAMPARTAAPEPTPTPRVIRVTPAPLHTAPPTPTPEPTTQVSADSAFAGLAAGVVQAYLAAVARGDDASAYAAFGTNPGDSGVKLLEKGIVDANTSITRVDAQQTGTNAATVQVTLQTSGGRYFGQYFLKRSPTGAALIEEHAFIKP